MAIDQDFIEQYRDLLIIQYWDKPKARATIESFTGEFSRVYDFFFSFFDEFDLDQATGDRLDIIGKIVGVPRIVPFGLAKKYFGFDDNVNALGFSSSTESGYVGGALFKSEDPLYTDTQLADPDYRFFIRAKIAKNIVSAYMDSDDRISVQDAITTLFDGKAFVVDKYNMGLWLYISPSFDLSRIQLINQLELLPKPQGVRYDLFIQADIEGSFGFSNNPNSSGFSSYFDPAYQGGYLARRVL